MTRKLLYIAISALLIFSSCNKISESIQRDIIVSDTVYFDIPLLDTATTPTTISDIQSSLDIEAQIKAKAPNFNSSKISNVKLTRLNMSLKPIKLPTKDSVDVKNNFGNLATVRFRISGAPKTDYLANASIPSASTIGALALIAPTLPENLKDFIGPVSIKYNVVVSAKAVTTKVINVGAAITYTVTLSE